MRAKKQLMACLLSFALLLSMIPTTEISAVKKVKLSTTKLTVKMGKSKTLKVKNTNNKVEWKILFGKKNISLKRKGKAAAIITGRTKGAAKVQAKIAKKKLICKIVVQNAKMQKVTNTPTSNQTNNPMSPTETITSANPSVPPIKTTTPASPSVSPIETMTPSDPSVTPAATDTPPQDNQPDNDTGQIKLRDGALEQNLYEITVKDNGSKRDLLIKGMSDDEIFIPSLLAVNGSHFCITSKEGYGTLLSSDKIIGTVNGSGMEVLFKYENQGGAGSDGGLRFFSQAAYCDLYASTNDGKPISGLSLSYDNLDGDLNMGMVSMICYNSKGEITQRTHRDMFYQITGHRGINGYSMLTHWGTHWDGLRGQIFPDLTLGRKAYTILDDAGKEYEDNYGEGNRYTWAYKTDESNDEFTILAPDGSKIADVLVYCHATDYFSTSASDFEYDYEVKNLVEGWDISVNMSETSFVPSIITGENIPCDPALLMSITVKRKLDDGLDPVSYEFDGRQDLTFSFTGIEGIKEIKKIYFNCSENVQDGEDNWLSYVSYYDLDLVDLEKKEVTISKEDIYDFFCNRYSSVGNSYQGSMIYITEDGSEKTAYGEWYIKVLETKN